MPSPPTPVRDLDTGETWPTIKDAAKALNAPHSTVSYGLIHHKPVRGRWLVADVIPPICMCCREMIEQPMTEAEIIIRKKRGLPVPAQLDIQKEVERQIG